MLQASSAICDEKAVFCSLCCWSSDIAPNSHVICSIFCTSDFYKKTAYTRVNSKMMSHTVQLF